MVAAADLEERLRALTDRFDVPGATLAVLQDGEVTTVAVGEPQPRHRRRGHHRQPVPDRVDHEALHDRGRDAVRRARRARPRRARGQDTSPSSPPPTRTPRAPSRCGTCSPTPAASTATTSSTPAAATTCSSGTSPRAPSCRSSSRSAPRTPTATPASASPGGCSRWCRAQVWDEVLREEVLAPLGLDHTMTLPEDALRHRVACGHVGDPGELRLAPQWGLPRSCGPGRAGARHGRGRRRRSAAPCSTSATGSRRACGREPARSHRWRCRTPTRWASHWGVGWILYDAVDGRAGGGPRRLARSARPPRCAWCPTADVAVALLLNGGGDGRPQRRRCCARSCARRPTSSSAPALEPVEGADGGDRDRQVGTYRRSAETIEIEPHGDAGLRVTVTDTSHLADLIDEDPEVVELRPVAEHPYVGRRPGAQSVVAFVFFDLDGARFLHAGARAFGGWAGDRRRDPAPRRRRRRHPQRPADVR